MIDGIVVDAMLVVVETFKISICLLFNFKKKLKARKLKNACAAKEIRLEFTIIVRLSGIRANVVLTTRSKVNGYYLRQLKHPRCYKLFDLL